MSLVKKISRREAMMIGSAGLLTAAGTALATAGDNGQGLSTAGRAVSIMSPSEPNFTEKLDRFFPGLRQESGYQNIAPLAALVTNVGDVGIKALSSTWIIKTSNGVYRTILFSYLRAGSKDSISARRSVVRSGETRLLTPFFLWSSRHYQFQSSRNWEQILHTGELQNFLLQEQQKATSIQVQLNAVVFADWTAFGPDNAYLSQHIQLRRNAERTEAMAALALIEGKATKAELVAVLNQHQTIDGIVGVPIARSEVRRFLFFKSRALYARVLLNRLKAERGMARLIGDLRQLRSLPATHIANITA